MTKLINHEDMADLRRAATNALLILPQTSSNGATGYEADGGFHALRWTNFQSTDHPTHEDATGDVAIAILARWRPGVMLVWDYMPMVHARTGLVPGDDRCTAHARCAFVPEGAQLFADISDDFGRPVVFSDDELEHARRQMIHQGWKVERPSLADNSKAEG